MALDKTLLGAQKGLLTKPVFGQLLTIKLKHQDDTMHTAITGLIRDLDNTINSKHQDCGLVAAFSPALWGKWTGRDIPIRTKVLDGKHSDTRKFRNTGGDILLYVKAPSHEKAQEIVSALLPDLEPLVGPGQVDITIGGKRSDSRVIGGRYVDGITNPNDPVTLVEDILIRDGPYPGSCFGLSQKFEFDWPAIATQTADAQDEMIGRNVDGAVLSQHGLRGHVHRAGNVRDANGDQKKILRQAMPYGTAGGYSAREEGIMFVAFCNEQERFEALLKHLVGKQAGHAADLLLATVQGIGGSYWYVPAAAELGVAGVSGPDDIYEEDHWNVRSKNGYLFYNSQDYLHQMGQHHYVGGDPPSDRVLGLMARAFNHWRDGWLHRQNFPRLPHLSILLDPKDKEILRGHEKDVALLKALANSHTLAGLLSSPDSTIAKENNLLRIEARELIVGQIPDFTLGRGKEVVPYLDQDEELAHWLKNGLNEHASMGHIVPDYDLVVKKGVQGLIDDLQSRREAKGGDANQSTFYKASIISLHAVQSYLENWALNCDKVTQLPGQAPEDVQNMKDNAARLRRLVNQPPETFQDAVQLIFSFHCCLHLVGELTSFCRLDQILWPFWQREKESLSTEKAQDIIDCLFIKIGENAFIDRAFIYDYCNIGTCAVCGIGGNFPQGGGINQWVQQITVGGYKFTDDEKPEGGANPVTMLFLKAARRIPVNAPTVSLRTYKDIPQEFLDEAAKCLLSGGAQPMLYNDDKLCQGLLDSGSTVTRAWSRNYAADGCYEPMFAGANDFTFASVALMQALEQTLNQGATYGAAGPIYLRGLKQTFRSPPAKEMKTFEQLQEVFVKQLEWLVIQCYNVMLSNYGNLVSVCPSPLLSVVIDGCSEKGRDLTDGGGRFHLIAPMCMGVSNTIDSLYAIKKLVYDPETAITTLQELVRCLMNDWGFNMVEPFQDQLLGPADAAEHGLRFQQLRDTALALPKWGGGDEEVNALGEWLMDQLVRLCTSVIDKDNPSPALKPQLDAIKERYKDDEGGFEFVVTPGIGTFEGYVGDGAACGASADGRRNGSPLASDMSPAPAPQDLNPPNPRFRNIYQAMKSVKGHAAEYGLSNATPVDMNIQESFPLDELQQFVKAFAAGDVGGNLISLTCADLSTYAAASRDPEKYNLIRVRMGGWTEFYATMFPEHQKQQQRRQYFTH
ncbi:PFL-like glycyl radical enzyme [Cryphonectria parasitica EP155]|uniref:PFL-like glycyl radical enzyme n=1 Tax=Cryphonectria parasitica (strain ATCC 38755 / EP155) TaxID=660469 RepID=A0A9P4XXI0_CRYP1|nr:PFL-like glycyl radical enzyme [Cryphonectria parasitica EP155]KAF3762686.1 PFL-like glycyl radical enzyme [Cryphonectria parasitica EP155]